MLREQGKCKEQLAWPDMEGQKERTEGSLHGKTCEGKRRRAEGSLHGQRCEGKRRRAEGSLHGKTCEGKRRRAEGTLRGQRWEERGRDGLTCLPCGLQPGMRASSPGGWASWPPGSTASLLSCNHHEHVSAV